MSKIRITSLAQVSHQNLISTYENPLEEPCSLSVGQVFVSINAECPEGFCLEAWKTVGEYVRRLSNGERNFFNGWMKNPASALISCNDGFRPMSFLLEVIEE